MEKKDYIQKAEVIEHHYIPEDPTNKQEKQIG